MKKNTMIAVRDFLTSVDALPEVVAEINAELSKGDAQKAKNAEAYEGIHDIIMENLADEPCTVAELWDVIKDKVPDSITKNKVQYALTHLWQDEIVKVEGKPNGYRRA